MFIRKKIVHGKKYYYIVNSSKGKQKEMYIGKTLSLDLVSLYRKRKKRKSFI